MEIGDREHAKNFLASTGYYRLKGYAYPFRIIEHRINGQYENGQDIIQEIVKDEFRPDTNLQTIRELYAFDKKLRLLILDGIERIEIALRTDIALALGKYSSFAHRKPEFLNRRFATQMDKGLTQHEYWLSKLDRDFGHSNEAFIMHFKEQHPNQKPPVYMALELISLGSQTRLLKGLKRVDQTAIAQKYGLERRDTISSWSHTLTNLRNACAHHNRVWNRPRGRSPKLPRLGLIPEIDHIAVEPTRLRLYGTMAIMQWMIKTINPSSQWCDRIKAHYQRFPDNPNLSISAMAFPLNWEDLPLWNA